LCDLSHVALEAQPFSGRETASRLPATNSSLSRAAVRLQRATHYNSGVKAVLKSLAAALVGMALFFSFFMMISIPVLIVWAKLHDPNAPLQAPDVVLAPGALFRSVGLPLSAAAFAVCFILAMKKFRKTGP
jgi:hypothetical protein